MASNIAARRAAKANRRKIVLAEKRKAELQAGSLATRVAQAASAPLRHCLLSDGWQDIGTATLILTRGFSASHLTMGTFLLDTFCLGIKDVVFRPIEGDEFAAYLDATGIAAVLSPIDPAFGRKLMRDLAAWSSAIGMQPHRDYATVERLFGTISADACTEEFRFGQDGKPLYIPGPYDSPRQVRHLSERFEQRFNEVGSGLVLEGSDLLLEG